MVKVNHIAVYVKDLEAVKDFFVKYFDATASVMYHNHGTGFKYWNMVYGKNIGDVLNDEEGMANMRNLGQNMAWTLKRLNKTI